MSYNWQAAKNKSRHRPP